MRVRAEEGGQGGQPGFRWDPALQRWLKDDRMDGNSQPTTVKTKTGQEYTVWPVMHTVLVEAGVKGVSPEEAQKMMQKGYTLLDARITSQYEEGHPAGALNAPLYRLVPEEKTDFWNMSKKITSALLMQDATEQNPDFLSTAEAAAGGKSKVILACNLGGTLKTTVSTKKKTFADPDRGFGRESRSLKACYALVQAGFKEVYFLEGGFPQWRVDGYGVE